DRTERVADRSFFEGCTEGAGDAAQELCSQVVLTTEFQITPSVAGQTDRSMTTEQTATVVGLTISQVETAFQLENCFQAVAQIFCTLQTPAVARLNAVVETSAGSLAVTCSVVLFFELCVADTSINDTVQGNRCYCLSNASEADGKSSSEQSLFHVRNLRRF